MSEFEIFFSSRTADRGAVAELTSALKRRMPHLKFHDCAADLPDAAGWKETAQQKLETCSLFVCVVGPTTSASENVDWEVERASAFKKPMVFVRESASATLPKSFPQGTLVMPWVPEVIARKIAEQLQTPGLFNRHDWSTGEPTPDDLWQQYSIMVQSWETLIARRQAVNTWYVTAAGAVLAGVGVLISRIDDKTVVGVGLAICLVSLIGLGLSLNWRRILKSYGSLSRAKSDVVGALEEQLPVRLFDAEWSVLERLDYKSTTQTETQTALFFVLLFSVIAAVAGVAALSRLLG